MRDKGLGTGSRDGMSGLHTRAGDSRHCNRNSGPLAGTGKMITQIGGLWMEGGPAVAWWTAGTGLLGKQQNECFGGVAR